MTAGKRVSMVTIARRLAYQALWRVSTQSSFSSYLLPAYLEKEALSDRDRRLITELVYGCLRWQGRLDWVISRFSHSPLSALEVSVLIALRLGCYQLLFLERIPPSAAVKESVELAKMHGSPGSDTLVNAVLRQICRQGGNIPLPQAEKDQFDYLTITQSHPRWLVERWLERFGFRETAELVEANNLKPPLFIRVNRLKTIPEELKRELEKEEIEVEGSRYLPDSFRVVRGRIASSRPVKEGLCYLQDEASQMVSFLVSPRPEDWVLDVCAAPGSKACHLASLMNNRGYIVANDIHLHRLKVLRENCRLLGADNIRMVVADFTRQPGLRYEFDRVLVDAPCTSLGRIRRSPELKWRRRPEDVDFLSVKQKALLHYSSQRVKKGGILVYAVCSWEREETEEVVENFLEENNGFRVVAPRDYLPGALHPLVAEDGFLRTFPHRHDMDGFFSAVFTRGK
ncbi:MAG: 16S rRNA (cytosine(967)-C(5))-methyltransferase RsmB [Candidatus Aminicenantes bacterium]|nr:16S rRNA (cytosine(967)-C(5))-methyltransferase RsmB [Candidatus Aminicenantes bacterium]